MHDIWMHMHSHLHTYLIHLHAIVLIKVATLLQPRFWMMENDLILLMPPRASVGLYSNPSLASGRFL